jgi:vitamin B12 transporter
VDAGVDQETAEGKVRLSATYFYNRLSNTIGFANVAPAIGSTARPFGGYVNQKGGTSRGAEFSTRVRPFASTEVFASYTYTNSDQLQPQVTGTGYFRTLGVPDHQVTAVVTQRWRRFWINLDLLATSDYVAPIFSGSTFQTYLYRFRGNRRVDVTAGYTFLPTERLSVRLFGTVENIGDQTYFENGFRTPGRNARVGLSLAF